MIQLLSSSEGWGNVFLVVVSIFGVVTIISLIYGNILEQTAKPTKTTNTSESNDGMGGCVFAAIVLIAIPLIIGVLKNCSCSVPEYDPDDYYQQRMHTDSHGY